MGLAQGQTVVAPRTGSLPPFFPILLKNHFTQARKWIMGHPQRTKGVFQVLKRPDVLREEVKGGGGQGTASRGRDYFRNPTNQRSDMSIL